MNPDCLSAYQAGVVRRLEEILEECLTKNLIIRRDTSKEENPGFIQPSQALISRQVTEMIYFILIHYFLYYYK
jgi:hypothetical protein